MMDLGTGIFLGLIFLGLIWLYVATWQRWRWKRIVAWSFGIVGTPVICLGAWLLITNYLDSFPRPEDELWNLKPGMALEDVLFRKGEPNQKEKGFWFYMKESDDVGYVIRLTEDGRAVRAIQAFARQGKEFYLPSIQGISSYSTQENIERRFGKPDHVSINKDQTRRIFSYLKYRLAFELERNQVVSLAVFDGYKAVQYGEEGRAESSVGKTKTVVTK